MSSSSSSSSSPVSTDEESTTTSTIRAQIVTDLAACGARLRQGHLVAFPTETVYGLGCHALDVSAVAKVFQAKERPLTDPLIVHVLTADDAFDLWQIDRQNTSTARLVLQTLCDEFWPGPLTLVAAANRTVVPDTIMAGTGYCAVRSPSHTTARALITAAQRPLAAPSANKFGHVSPTTAQHVWDDLKYEDVWIVQDNNNRNDDDDDNDNGTTNSRKSLTCDVGVESTVAKLEMNDNNDKMGTLTVLRQGAVSVQDLEAALRDYPGILVEAKLKRATKDNVANVAPGQTIRHYSPNIPSFLLSAKCIQNIHAKTIVNGNQNDRDDDDFRILRNAVVIDYGAQLVGWKHVARAYYDLSPTGNSSLAAQTVFETLRWAEQVPNVDCILFPDLIAVHDALALAVKDRLTRAASGVVIDSLASIVVADKLQGQ